MPLACFAQCTPGLEAVLDSELAGLGVRRRRRGRGGVAFEATPRQLYAANVWLRTAGRVLVRVARFPARTWAELEGGARGVDWGRFGGGAPRLRVSASASRLYHTEAIAERLAPVVAAGGGGSDGGAHEGPLVVVRIAHDEVTLSVDSSGEALHRRGWRQEIGRAPLRETLAAAVLLASGWDGSRPLVDPFCGSGTFVIEAALLARGLAPGADRGFAFEGWRDFQPGTWASVRGELPARTRPRSSALTLLGRDRDAGAVAAAAANAARAGVAGDVRFEVGALSTLDVAPEPAGLLVANPPYGGRASAGRDLRDLYARFGDVARGLPGWRVALLAADRRLAGHARLAGREVLRTSNGGRPVALMVAEQPRRAPCR